MKKIFLLLLVLAILFSNSSIVKRPHVNVYSGNMSGIYKEVYDKMYSYVSEQLIPEEQEIEESIPTPVEPEYSPEDAYLLAQMIYCEAGGCDREEMARVGTVILNRVKTDFSDFTNCNTIYEVLIQENQYPETFNKIQNGIVPSEDAIEVSNGLISGEIDSGLSEDVLWQTGFEPNFKARVIYKNQWHYYSVPKETTY